MRTILLYFFIKYNENWDKIYKALETKERIDLEKIEKLDQEVSKGKYNFIAIVDDNYPKEFMEIYKPPFIVMLDENGNYDKNKYIIN